MMSLLLPLGLLGLLSIAALILIYLLKPNYQQKIISSTHVWKLSLKYKKKRLPISRFRNILLFLCQILILTSCALILAQPVIRDESASLYNEKIYIVDSSANMLTEYNGETRFERAITQLKEEVDEVLSQNGTVSVILADSDPEFLLQREGAVNREEIFDLLNDLILPGDLRCSYGQADVDSAMKLAEDIIEENSEVEVIYFTGTKYLNYGQVTVRDVAVRGDATTVGEWNAAILDCTAVTEENYYIFTVDVACYARNTDLVLHCDLSGVNNEGREAVMSIPVRCYDDETQRVEFNTANMGEFVYKYDYAYIYFEDAEDSFTYDNVFYLYGGTRQSLNIQYYSITAEGAGGTNPFFSTILMAYQDEFRDRWDINISEVRAGTPELEGYDLYIFEHTMPETLPKDGIVILVDPDRVPTGAGFVLAPNNPQSGNFSLAPGEAHPITDRFFDAEAIAVTQYKRITANDGFTTLMYCGGDPVLLVKNEPKEKVVVFGFEVKMSDFVMLKEFPTLMFNLFQYFLPSTLREFVFDVDETVELNARSPELKVTGLGEEFDFNTFPSTLTLERPGTYTLTQTPISGKDVVENLYVKIAADESNIVRELDELKNPYLERNSVSEDYDLLIYFAAALVALLFAEWWLQSKDQF